MQLDLTVHCPKCQGTRVVHKQLLSTNYSCEECSNHFQYADPYIGTQVRINKPFSVWNSLRGKIVEILPDTKYPVRVKFEINKQSYGELFHPTHLEIV